MKDVVIYLVLLIAIDTTANLVLLMYQDAPYPIILTSMIIRPISIISLYSVSLLLVSLFPIENKMIIVGLGAIFSYLLAPIIYYLIKSNQKSLIETIVDIHSKWFLYSGIYIPFIIAVVLNILLFKKFFRW